MLARLHFLPQVRIGPIQTRHLQVSQRLHSMPQKIRQPLELSPQMRQLLGAKLAELIPLQFQLSRQLVLLPLIQLQILKHRLMLVQTMFIT